MKQFKSSTQSLMPSMAVLLVALAAGCKGAPATAPAAPQPAPDLASSRSASVVLVEPVLVVLPGPIRTQQYCSILDIQFEVDKDENQREEKERLGVLGTFLTKYPDTTAVIEGHTDNVVPEEHDMALSQHRAQNVVNYLVDKFGTARSQISVEDSGWNRRFAYNTTAEGRPENRRVNIIINYPKRG